MGRLARRKWAEANRGPRFHAMLAPNNTIAANPSAVELSLPTFDVRAIAGRAAVPALLAIVAVGAVLFASSHVQAVADELGRVLSVNPAWAAVAVVLECASLAGYVGLLSLVAGRAAPRVGLQESAQITFAGAAATRLLPTAGAGGLALALWALRQAGLRSRAATRTLLAFLVVLYSVFLAAIVLSGAALALGLVANHGPAELSAIPATMAALGIGLALLFATRRGVRADAGESGDPDGDERRRRITASAQFVGDAVRDASGLVRTGD